jgi:hypothetical protein
MLKMCYNVAHFFKCLHISINHNTQMKQKNRAVIIAGFLALLATAIVAGTYNLQSAKA